MHRNLSAPATSHEGTGQVSYLSLNANCAGQRSSHTSSDNPKVIMPTANSCPLERARTCRGAGGFEDDSPPSHNSKTVLSIVKIGPPRKTRTSSYDLNSTSHGIAPKFGL